MLGVCRKNRNFAVLLNVSILVFKMDEISQTLASKRRERSDSVSTDATQSTNSKLALQHRVNQLMMCLDDLDPENELHEKVVKTLDNAFFVCGMRANKPKKDKFRWKESFCVSMELFLLSF